MLRPYEEVLPKHDPPDRETQRLLDNSRALSSIINGTPVSPDNEANYIASAYFELTNTKPSEGQRRLRDLARRDRRSFIKATRKGHSIASLPLKQDATYIISSDLLRIDTINSYDGKKSPSAMVSATVFPQRTIQTWRGAPQPFDINDVLLDTGACPANYISTSLVKANPDLYKRMVPSYETVRLGGTDTVVKLDGTLTLPIMLYKGIHSVQVDLKFQVFNTVTLQMIIGLDAIVSKVDNFFCLAVFGRPLAPLTNSLDKATFTPLEQQETSLPDAYAEANATFPWSSSSPEAFPSMDNIATLNHLDEHDMADLNTSLWPSRPSKKPTLDELLSHPPPPPSPPPSDRDIAAMHRQLGKSLKEDLAEARLPPSLLAQLNHVNEATPLTATDTSFGFRQTPLDELLDVAENLITRHPFLSPLVPPFVTSFERAKEEDLIPDPCDFQGLLSVIEHDEPAKFEQYCSLFDTHVEASFLDFEDVRTLLLEKGRRVFIPDLTNWTGIKQADGSDWIFDIVWKDDLPHKMRPRFNAHINNRKLSDAAKKEFNRLSTYMYTSDSTSPWCSAAVVAAKATEPFVRICGDYPGMNKFIETGHYPIPIPKHELAKLKGYSLYADLDMTNSFHQLRLSTLSSRRLSVQFPWGVFRPQFLPEGVSPATFMLHEAVTQIFADFSEWMIVIFDNFLVLAHDKADLKEKLDKVFTRCIERNLFLKFAKTYIGYTKCNFFGYECNPNGYRISDTRIQGIKDIPFPRSTKDMQSFLGTSLFCNNFIPHYSSLCAPLNDMVHKDFDWIALNKERTARDKAPQPEPIYNNTIPLPDRDTDSPQAAPSPQAIPVPAPPPEPPPTANAKAPPAASSERKPLAYYEEVFDNFKHAVGRAMGLYHPDYSLPWILRTDASQLGVGAALFQITKDGMLQPLAFISKKFTGAATRWDTIHQEMFGIFYAVQQLRHLLQGKHFLLETDHANLQQMELSEKHSIIRMRHYLQSFSFLVRHIKGTLNKDADLLSRLFREDDIPIQKLCAFSPGEQPTHCRDSLCCESSTHASLDRIKLCQPCTPTKSTLENFLAQVHNKLVGHWGPDQTFDRFRAAFPHIPIKRAFVKDWVDHCVTCQKFRLARLNTYKPAIKTHHQGLSYHSKVGIDLAELPTSASGYSYLTIIVNFLSKRVWLYPQKTKDAKECARSLLNFYVREGRFDMLCSDPGSDYTSELVRHFNDWLQVKQVFSLVDRPQGSNVEGSVKKVTKVLRDFVFDSRNPSNWSDPEVILLVEKALNDSFNSEVGASPMQISRGDLDSVYLHLPPDEIDTAIATASGLPPSSSSSSTPIVSEKTRTHVFVQLLKENLESIRELASDYHTNLDVQRRDETVPSLVPGSFVLLLNEEKRSGQFKLQPLAWGPFEVQAQRDNDITIKSLVDEKTKIVHISRLAPFIGDRKAAFTAALYDNDEHEIEKILAYRGDPHARSSLEFLVLFQDQTTSWLGQRDVIRYENHDVMRQQELADFITLFPALKVLERPQKQVSKWLSSLDKQPIDPSLINAKGYFDLRSYGYDWYRLLELPDFDTTLYVLEVQLKAPSASSKRGARARTLAPDLPPLTRLEAIFPALRDSCVIGQSWIETQFWPVLPKGAIIIDTKFIEKYPQILTKSE